MAEQSEQSKWAKLPEPISREDWVAEETVRPVPGSVSEAPSPEQIDRDQMLRWAAGGS